VSILDRIVDSVRTRLEDTRRKVPLADVRRHAEQAPRRPSFREALAAPGTSLIAEAKCASPSRGVLRDPYDPADLARTYEAAGARAMSVLTEPEFFRGSPDHLRAVRDACSLPLLRKDFVVDAYQLWEARAWGASAALLIVAALDDVQLRDLHALTEELGLDALVEAHTEDEADRALGSGARIVGVNNRDLRTFETDRATTARVASRLPDDVLLVSESGIHTRAHVREVEAAGASAVLVGEALVTADDPAARIAELIGRGENA
jgi:indole-3-glycerol phosphate synthase